VRAPAAGLLSRPTGRWRLFEFHESPWVPRAIGESVVEVLGLTMRLGGISAALATPYRSLVTLSGARQVLELASGSGETSTHLHALARFDAGSDITLSLSDLTPRTEHWATLGERFSVPVCFVDVPVDATAVPAAIGAGRVWMLLNAFHHLEVDQATAMLERAVQSGKGVFISENFGASVLATLPCGVVGMLAALLNPLLTKRDRVLKASLTYLLPVIPLVVAWDGLVSAMRMHRPADVRAMTARWPAWEWELRDFRYLLIGRGTVLVGRPRD
jgi:hypothetical protein